MTAPQLFYVRPPKPAISRKRHSRLFNILAGADPIHPVIEELSKVEVQSQSIVVDNPMPRISWINRTV
ncbi:MAG TPA: hypothetical protein VJQ79_04240 [Acidimicrobiia bacterium]|nr:hypothetical protein [Acidimicrobiia bacterium]